MQCAGKVKWSKEKKRATIGRSSNRDVQGITNWLPVILRLAKKRWSFYKKQSYHNSNSAQDARTFLIVVILSGSNACSNWLSEYSNCACRRSIMLLRNSARLPTCCIEMNPLSARICLPKSVALSVCLLVGCCPCMLFTSWAKVTSLQQWSWPPLWVVFSYQSIVPDLDQFTVYYWKWKGKGGGFEKVAWYYTLWQQWALSLLKCLSLTYFQHKINLVWYWGFSWFRYCNCRSRNRRWLLSWWRKKKNSMDLENMPSSSLHEMSYEWAFWHRSIQRARGRWMEWETATYINGMRNRVSHSRGPNFRGSCQNNVVHTLLKVLSFMAVDRWK